MTYDHPTGASSEGTSTAQTARTEASGMAHNAAESGRNLAGEAGTQAKEVAAEAGRQAKDLLEQGRNQLASQAGEQKSRLTGGLRTFGSDLGSMADGSQENGIAAGVARTIADQTNSLASWLDDKEPADLLEDVKRFARQRPGTFLAIAAGLGLVAGRLTRGVKDAGSGSAQPPERVSAYGTGAAHRAPGAPSTPATMGFGDAEATQAYGTTGGTSAYATPGTAGTTGAYGTPAPTTTYGTTSAAGQTAYSGGSGYTADTAGSTGTEHAAGTDDLGTASGDPLTGVEAEENR